MSHYEKKFEDESQDARRRDQNKEAHPNKKQRKHMAKPMDANKVEERK